MTSDRSAGDSAPEAVLGSLLALPHAAFAAMAADGVLLPMPESVGLAPERALPVPPDRATMLDAIAPSDAMTVVVAWERALTTGLGTVTVRTRQNPDQPMSLTFVDVRPVHGVLLGVLHVAGEEQEAPSAPEGEWITVSRAPRTATATKSGLAVVTGIDERTTRMLGWTPEEMVGRRSSEFIHPEDQERAIANWLELLSTQASQRVRLRHLRADGSWAWLELENHYTPAEDPADAVVLTHMNDISDEMAAHEALRQQERLLRRVAESLPLAILQLGADRSVVFANPRFDELVGRPGADPLAALTAALRPDDRAVLDTALAAALDEGRDGELEVAVRVPGGQVHVCAVGVIALGEDEGAPGALLSFADVSAHVRTREELTVRAMTDPLTGLANREAVSAALDEALADLGDALIGVLFVDLDGFKPINDTHGHDVGDEVLKLTAARLRAAVRPDDVVGRIGGDEFFVISRGHAEPETALELGHRVRAALAEPARLPQGHIPVSASVGVAWGRAGSDPLDLMRQADKDMYRAKQRRHSTPDLAEATRRA
ncbi:sensor domain-containing protein [Trujillonella endophytica]|uniref:PAS domain S-box-containing protein/diguanylate cyclase (GGDEF) domain-containing protein n=1 Tax=Trujillonella endophytica TaxID=673521 RepID=A0A1H8V8V4_9ACTN|nr:GGDEF domain-containing protein [Trujillella endophytica]SEP11865.1 PAS domain S-box-containing protein/diguanylate cyclase (GGDEF) domain-containing protein [Trujillella endophytica]